MKHNKQEYIYIAEILTHSCVLTKQFTSTCIS